MVEVVCERGPVGARGGYVVCLSKDRAFLHYTASGTKGPWTSGLAHPGRFFNHAGPFYNLEPGEALPQSLLDAIADPPTHDFDDEPPAGVDS